MAKGMSEYERQELQQEKKYGIQHKWVALSNTTLGAMLASIDSSILIISLPAVFNGLGVNPLSGGNLILLLWLLLGYTIVSLSQSLRSEGSPICSAGSGYTISALPSSHRFKCRGWEWMQAAWFTHETLRHSRFYRSGTARDGKVIIFSNPES